MSSCEVVHNRLIEHTVKSSFMLFYVLPGSEEKRLKTRL